MTKEELDQVESSQSKFNYMLLARLQQDCEYYLNHGNKNKKHLWALNEQNQIDKMKELFNSLDEKPDWISMKEIESFEKAMIVNQ